jgi:SH3-like domain-containing protein
MLRLFLITFLLSFSVSAVVQAQDPYNASGQPIPRFVSLASDKVFVRSGPALRYPIKWVFQRENMPVEVVQEFDTWRKVKDVNGDVGWIHQSLLKGKRTVIIQGEDMVTLLSKPGEKGKALAKLEPDVIASLEECDAVGWCKISAEGYAGWVPQDVLWGVNIQ